MLYVLVVRLLFISLIIASIYFKMFEMFDHSESVVLIFMFNSFLKNFHHFIQYPQNLSKFLFSSKFFDVRFKVKHIFF